MLRSFVANNFRIFSGLSLMGLDRINLVIGKNNTGKTALLESLYLFIGSMNPGLTSKLALFRGVPAANISAEGIWGSLFSDYDIKNIIELSGTLEDNTTATLNISVTPQKYSEIPLGKQRTLEEAEEVGLPADGKGQMLTYEYVHGETSKRRTASITPQGIKIDPAITANPFPGFFMPARFMLDPVYYANKFGEIQVKRQDYIVSDTLRILEPNLKSISTIPLAGIPVLHADIGGKYLIPLPLVGEGMTRVAEMVIDMVSAAGGIALIDDIDTGIHHSVLTDLWVALRDIAKRLNVQIFATTHSKECLEAAHETFKELSSYEFKVYRLQRTEDTSVVVSYDKDTLEAAIDAGLEVR